MAQRLGIAAALLGGAEPAAASGYGQRTGLAGLAERVSTVDGQVTVSSPRGGPTVISVLLPLKA